MSKQKKENNYAFIDSQNLNLGIQNQGWKLDYKKFRRYLRDKHRVTKAFFFIGYISSNENLYKQLKNAGYILIFKPVVQQKGRTKGNVDAELVLQAMHELCDNSFDKAVIVSGDGDFYCLVEYLVERKRLKKLLIPNQYKFSSLLRQYRNKGLIDFLNQQKGRLQRGK